jgi:hypothetical protein
LLQKKDVNSWTIAKTKSLDKITFVNDSFDTEGFFGGEDVFSPADQIF